MRGAHVRVFATLEAVDGGIAPPRLQRTLHEPQVHRADDVGVLAHSCYSLPHGRGLDGPLPYGDYFYLSTLALLAAAPTATM